MKLFLQPDPSDTWEQIHAAVFDLEAALKVEVVAVIRPATKTATTPGLVACPDCAKQVKPGGLGIHRSKAHGTPGATTVRPDGTPLAGPSDRLAKAAKVYADAQAKGYPNLAGAVATALDTTEMNARQLISRARKNGLLPRADGKPNDAA